MAEGYLLSENDRVLISRLLDWARSGRINTQNLPEDDTLEHEEMSTPEVYVALIPPDGIVGVNLNSPSGPGENDLVSSAVCSIYQAVNFGLADVLQLKSLAGDYQRRVFNLSLTNVPGNQWALVARDKFGNWFVQAVAASEATGTGAGQDCRLTVQDTYGFVQVLEVCVLQFCYEHFTVTDEGGRTATVCWRHHPEGGPNPCPYTYRRNRLYFCVAGRWQVWEQLWRVTIDASGCLKEELAGTYFVGYEGCCACDGGPVGTGTACIPGVCDLCTDPPRWWIITVFTFRGQCEKFNGVWQLTSISNCLWDNSETTHCLTTESGPGHCVTVTLTLSATRATLTFTDGIITATYTAPFDGNCCHPLTFVPGTSAGTGSPSSCGCDDSPPIPVGTAIQGDCDFCSNTGSGRSPTSLSIDYTAGLNCYSIFNGTWIFDSSNGCVWSAGDIATGVLVTVGIDPTGVVWVKFSGGVDVGAVYSSLNPITDCCTPFMVYLVNQGCPSSYGTPQQALRIDPSCGPTVVGDPCPAQECTDLYPNGNTPVKWSITGSGFPGDCAAFNTTFNLVQTGACSWASTGTTSASLYNVGGGCLQLDLITFIGGNIVKATYLGCVVPECCEPVVLDYTYNGCPGSPIEITLTPEACQTSDNESCAPSVTAQPDCCNGGEDACRPIECWLCPDDTPVQWHASPEGFTGDCALLDTAMTFDPINPCTWATSGLGTFQGTIELLHVLGTPSYDLLRLTLRTFQNGTLYTSIYQKVFTGDCCTVQVLSKDTSNCPGSPSTITIYPECCPVGTGSGAIGTGTSTTQWWCTDIGGVLSCVERSVLDDPPPFTIRGPYSSHEVCASHCAEVGTGTGTGTSGGGGITTDCCGVSTLPGTVKATFSNGNGGCACATGSINLTWNPTAPLTPSGGWVGSGTVCGVSVSLTWYCAAGGTDAGAMRLTIDFGSGCADCPNTAPFPGANCGSLNFGYLCGQGSISCCDDAFGAMQVNIGAV